LLQIAEQIGLLPTGCGVAAADAYRHLRQYQHTARLDEAPTQVDPALVEGEAAAIRRVWAHVLGVHCPVAADGT